MSDPATLAQRQLDAYNAHQLDAFVACYAEDVQVFELPSGDRMFQGRAALAERYGPYFEAQRPQAVVTRRRVLGRMAMDEEDVTLADGRAFQAVALYDVCDGLIQKVWFIKP
jgi:hypothetical protein